MPKILDFFYTGADGFVKNSFLYLSILHVYV